MTRDEHLFACLAEECGEIIQIVGKILRFGASDHHPKRSDIPNIELLNDEFNDLLGIISLLKDSGYSLFEDSHKIIKKYNKVLKYMEYSKSLGKISSKSNN